MKYIINNISKKLFDRKIDKYYHRIKEDFPELINNIDIINRELFYFVALYYQNKDIFNDTGEYTNTYDMKSTVLEVKRILKGINPEYEKKFVSYLNNKKIRYITTFKSCTNGKKIFLKKRNNIEDVIALIHELFHVVHLEKYNFDMNNSDWYTLSEMIAITFELYSLLKLYEKDENRNDLKKYFLLLILNMALKSDRASAEIMILNIYDKHKEINKDLFKEYIKEYDMPLEYLYVVNDFIKKNNKFIYHETAVYVFGFPLAFYMATRMIDDNEYFNKVINTLENINNYNYAEIIEHFGLTSILSKENGYDNLVKLVYEMNAFIKEIYKSNDSKKMGVK